MQGMEPHETIALLLGAISTYGLFLTSIGKEIWVELGIIGGWAVIGILCLTTVAWLMVIEIVRGLIQGEKR